jgi:hypothetical protein
MQPCLYLPYNAYKEDQILKPLYDRFELKVVTQYVESREARLYMLKRKQSYIDNGSQASITLDELIQMQDEVKAVIVPDKINELMDDILCELRSKGIHISDRKYFGYAPIAQAMAWLSGKTAVDSTELMALKYYLWTSPDDQAVINPILERMCDNPLLSRLENITTLGIDAYNDFEDAADAMPAKRIGKFRKEFVSLYQMIESVKAEAQNDVERELIKAAEEQLEAFSSKAHSATGFSYVRLSELYEIEKVS